MQSHRAKILISLEDNDFIYSNVLALSHLRALEEKEPLLYCSFVTKKKLRKLQ